MATFKTRKLFLLLIVFSLLSPICNGQQTEINFNAYTGLFSFRGNGASVTSLMHSSPYPSIPEVKAYSAGFTQRGKGIFAALRKLGAFA